MRRSNVTLKWKRSGAALHADVYLMGDFLDIAIGKDGNAYHVAADPYIAWTAVDVRSGYKGGQDTGKETKRFGTTFHLYKDTVKVAGHTTEPFAVGLAKDPFWPNDDGHLTSGFLGWGDDTGPKSIATEQGDKSLTSFRTWLSGNQKYISIVLKQTAIDEIGGILDINTAEPALWLDNDLTPDFGFKSATLNGQAVSDVWLSPRLGLTAVPFATATAIFKAAGVKTEHKKDEQDRPVIRGIVDCKEGITLTYEFKGQTLKVSGPATVFPSENGKCYAAIEGTEHKESTWGYSFFQALKVTWDPTKIRIGITPTGNVGGASKSKPPGKGRREIQRDVQSRARLDV
ncbi:unnamed protein product [Parajaminaea phylloscopi]